MNKWLSTLWIIVIFLSIDTIIEYKLSGFLFLLVLFFGEVLLGIILGEMEN